MLSYRVLCQAFLLILTLLISSPLYAGGDILYPKWVQLDTVIKHTDAQFTTNFRVWLKNERNGEAMVSVKLEGDVSAFSVTANQTGYPLGTLFPMLPGDSVWFDVKFESDPGQTSFLATLIATSDGESEDRLVLSSIYSPVKRAEWDETYVTLLAPNCQTLVRTQGFLINNGIEEVQVDSVKIVGDPTNSFVIENTSPADRLRDFTIAPGGGSVTYNLAFAPVSGSKESRLAKLIAFMESGENDTMNLAGIVSVSETEFDQSTISLGLQQMNQDIQQYASLENSGTGDFVVSAVEVLGSISVTLDGLDIDTIIEPQSSHSFKMTLRGTMEGEQVAQILVFGSPCDAELMLTVGAEFETSSVELDPHAYVRISYADHYLKFEHDEIVSLPYRILDITGRTIMVGAVEREALVNVSSLVNGSYFTILETSKGPVSDKFIKR